MSEDNIWHNLINEAFEAGYEDIDGFLKHVLIKVRDTIPARLLRAAEDMLSGEKKQERRQMLLLLCGSLYRRKQNRDKFEKIVETILENDKASDEVKRYTMYMVASDYAKDGRYEESEGVTRKLLGEVGEKETSLRLLLLILLGNLYYYKSMHYESLDVCKEALDLATAGNKHDFFATVYNNMATCLASLGRRREALKIYEEVLKIETASQNYGGVVEPIPKISRGSGARNFVRARERGGSNINGIFRRRATKRRTKGPRPSRLGPARPSAASLLLDVYY